jgi:hypothetical protein
MPAGGVVREACELLDSRLRGNDEVMVTPAQAWAV